ncbi:hypothetical protein PILCRDRAFT_105036 [Piloderma croceum F 1598]|uniref:Uncharacterized protein n=1 Tax=Piloderma croceum (strain F 1598) TaxID=765440 RepID=A0A0C3CQK2_PILCF|nr:hypothetical protein PILCRDRAFT_105036 [Piloderma croceum F 1598]
MAIKTSRRGAAGCILGSIATLSYCSQAPFRIIDLVCSMSKSCAPRVSTYSSHSWTILDMM